MQDTVKNKTHINWKGVLLLILIVCLCIFGYVYGKNYLSKHNLKNKGSNTVTHDSNSALRELENKFVQLQQDVKNALDGKTGSSEPSNIAEIKDAYFLTQVAADRLQFGDVVTAKKLLQLAQDRLAASNDPNAARVRSLLEADNLKLNNVEMPNLAIIQEKLSILNDLLNSLPPKDQNQKKSKSAKTAQHKKNASKDANWQQQLQDIIGDLKNVVKVRKKADGEAIVMYVNEEMDRAQFKLLIEQARWAVFYRDPIAFHRSLKNIQDLLIRDFDPENENVKTFAATLQELHNVQIVTNVPSIQDSINALQALLVG